MSWVGFENFGNAFAPLADAQLKAAYQDYKTQQDLSAMLHQQTADRIALQEANMKTGLKDPRVNRVPLDPYTARGMVSDFGIPINPRQPIQQVPVKNPNLPDTNLLQEADKAAKDAGLTSSLDGARRDISSEPYVENLPRELDPYIEALRQQYPQLVDSNGEMEGYTYNNLRIMAEAKAKIEANALAKAGELRSESFVKAYGENQANLRERLGNESAQSIERAGNQSAQQIEKMGNKSAAEIARERNATALKIAQINAARSRAAKEKGPDSDRLAKQLRIRAESILGSTMAKFGGEASPSVNKKLMADGAYKKLKAQYEAALDREGGGGSKTPPPVKKTYEQFLKDAGIKDSEKAKEIYKKKHSSIGSGQNRSIAGYGPGQTPIYREDYRPSRYMSDQEARSPKRFVPLLDRPAYNRAGQQVNPFYNPGEMPIPVEEPGYDRNKLTTDQERWRFDPITGKPIRR
jgi:hypothetical protein